MNNVTLCNDPYNPESWQTHNDVGDVRAFLQKSYVSWPKTAHIYHNWVAESADVTPYDKPSVDKLGELEGNFYVVVYPEGIELVVAIIAIAVAVVAIGLAILLRPSPNVKNQQQESPTNSLSNRQNRERPNERIPDIYGEKWVWPDLIALSYRIFIGNKEVEYQTMCIGRGEYDIAEVRDDLTPIEQIDGATVEIYGPNKSYNNGDQPDLRFGTNPINEKIKQVKQFSSANGQVLRAPNAQVFKSDKNVAFVYPDAVVASGDIDFTDYFAVGSITTPTHLTITNGTAKSSTGSTLDLSGTYEIADVQSNQITLVTPSAVNAAWSSLASFPGESSTYGSPVLTSDDDKWVGPFVLDEPNINEVWCNFVCPQGLYELDKNANQFSMVVQIQVGIQAIDSSKNPIGDEIFYSTTIVGSAIVRSQRAVTLKCPLPLAGPCQVRARRYSSTDLRDNWNVVDQTQWRDLYSVAPLGVNHFGNVTHLQAVTWPTQDALAIKQRKLNCLVARRIPFYRPKFYAQGPEQASDNGVRGTWNETSRELIWMTARPTTSTAKIGTWVDGVFSEVTLTGIDTGNSGGVDPQTLFVDANYFYINQGSGYDTSKWYKFSRTGGGPVASIGGIGVFSGPFGNPNNSDFGTISGTQYIFHRDGSLVARIATGGMSLIDSVDFGDGSTGPICNDGSNTWGCIASGGIGKIDWGASTHTNYTVGMSGSPLNIRYVAADNSLLIATQTHIYKFDIATTSIVSSIAVTLNWGGISEVGSDGNFITDSAKYDASTLAVVSTFDLSNYTVSGPWTGFSYNKSLFIGYDVAQNRLLSRDVDAQVWGINLTQSPGISFTTLSPDKNAARILFAMALDPYIGNRQESEIDFETIDNEFGPGGKNELYFGTPLCSEFCYAFDDSKVSFEEMALDVGNAAFSTIYRRGNILSAMFEQQTANSTILFNHRNKLPDSETRTVNFGMPQDTDGIQLDYIDPKAPNQPNIDVTTTLNWPTDNSAINPKKITAIGVRNNVQAYMMGWRLFNKLKYQNTAVQFDATQEAAACINGERILIADNTRPETQDGEVVAQISLELELSQPVTFVGGRTYTIFLQHYDGSVEAKTPITAGSTDKKIVLPSAPALPLVLDQTKFGRTTYIIVDDSPVRSSAFLLSEKEPKDQMVYSMKAFNYDDRYYSKDQDFNLGNVTENSGSGGYNSGYTPQSQIDVFVDGTAMPWNPKDNPSMDYGENDGKPPVAVPLYTSPGATINVSAFAPGEYVQVWRWFYQTNTVKAASDVDPVDANGDPAHITGTSLDSHGKKFPTYYAAVGAFALGRCGLIGIFAKKNVTTGKYEVRGDAEPMGFNWSGVQPADSDYLLLGTNDTIYRDNSGGFNVTVTQIAVPPDPTGDTNTGDSSDGQEWQVDGHGPGELVPPAGEFVLTEKFGHNVAASSTYDKSHHAENFTGTSRTGSGTTVSVDSSKMDDSMNPSTPSHVSDAPPSALVPAAPGGTPFIVHVTPWFGKNGHINIGVNCNTDAYAIALWKDLNNRGYDGISVDWYGQSSFENQFLLKFQAYNLTTSSPKKIVICLDKGIPNLSQATLITEIGYINTQYFSDPNYLKISGIPLLQFFGIRERLKTLLGSDAAADTAMSAVKSGTATAHWHFFQQSLRHKSYCDGCFDWTHNFVNGVDDASYGTDGPYNINAVNQFYTDMTDEPTKTIGGSLVPGFNGTLTKKTSWSLNKYLQRNHGACWIARAAASNSNYSSVVKYYMVATWSDYEEGSQIETGIENDISFSAASITGTNVNWTVTGGTGDESTIYTYRIIRSGDGVFGKYIGTIAPGIGTFDLSGNSDLEAGKTYDIYVEAVGKNSVRCKFSNKMVYSA